jgi:TRAP-type C4-dicarboxylate transport system substrate-binding protein
VNRVRRNTLQHIAAGSAALAGTSLLAACERSAAPARQHVLKVGGSAPAGTVADDYFQQLQRNLARDEPAWRVVLLTRGELGSDGQVFTALRHGRVQLAICGMHSVATAVPEIAVLAAPYLFGSEREVDAAVARGAMPALAPLCAAQGVELLDLMPMGWHNIYGRRPHRTPQSLEGVRFRQPTDVASEKFALALGADLIPLPSSDLVSALQTGLVEAGATVTLNYLWSGIADYAPNLTMTRHAYLVNALMVHKPWWDAEAAASRSRILAALPSATQFVARMRAAETRELQRAVAAGRVTSTEPSAEELAAWRALAPRVHEEIIEAVGARAPGVLLAVQPPPAQPARLR